MRERIEALEALLVETRGDRDGLRDALQEAERRQEAAEQEAATLRDQLQAMRQRSLWQRLRAVFTP